MYTSWKSISFRWIDIQLGHIASNLFNLHLFDLTPKRLYRIFLIFFMQLRVRFLAFHMRSTVKKNYGFFISCPAIPCPFSCLNLFPSYPSLFAFKISTESQAHAFFEIQSWKMTVSWRCENIIIFNEIENTNSANDDGDDDDNVDDDYNNGWCSATSFWMRHCFSFTHTRLLDIAVRTKCI